MRLRQLKVAGFRGFNEERTILFADRLTLVSAPNSHGKTSITEALEFLLFGETSKVKHAQAKEEYRDCYRNSHWPGNAPAYIEATVVTPDPEGKIVVLRIELASSGGIRKFVDGSEVTEWPFAREAAPAAPPFVLQHALKYLLLVAPTDRFQGFARLLGLDEIDELQRAIVSLCTKPEATIPAEGSRAVADLASVESRMSAFADLQKASKEFKKGAANISAAYTKIEERSDKVLGRKVPAAERVARLVKMRDDQSAKVYSGTVAIGSPDARAQALHAADEESLRGSISTAFLEDWAKLCARGVADRLAQQAQLLSIGIELIAESPETCPLCGQPLNDELRAHVTERHESLKGQVGPGAGIDDVQTRVGRVLASIRSTHARHQRYIESRAADLLQATSKDNETKVSGLFGKANEASWGIVRSAASEVAPLQDALTEAGKKLEEAMQACEAATKKREETSTQSETLANALNGYLESAKNLAAKLADVEPVLLGPARVLRQAIDELAGTAELTLLIELLEKRRGLERALKIRDVLEGLKDLKKTVEQTVGETMEAAITADLTGSVMSWYGRIRTKGDPDVHFSGFAMDRTKAGDFKKGKVKINASSYGVELASAVSSLSESKLNALGLCVSIASALRSPGPWEFIVLDDPIQSWDEEHETQFVEVVRALAERENKQVILLTHKKDWARSVCMGCRSLNGLQYEITGYTKDGPQLREVEWASVDQRLREIETIANSPHATGVQLQQAEEEVRIAACQLASEITKVKLKRDSSPHKMNKNDVRSVLVASGCPTDLTDKVFATFGTADDAHHAPKTYTANAQRIRQYLGTLKELARLVADAKQPGSS
ncbi:MAG: AAA family ATPase [Candidatus Kerfeldbacteria bacterium]